MRPRQGSVSSCAVALAVTLIAGRAGATDYYVATSGSPGPVGSNNNAGTSAAAPFATIARAVQMVQPGETIFLRGGSYATYNIPLRSGL